MTQPLDVSARVEVDASGAIPPLKDTQRALNETAAAAAAGSRQLAGASNSAAAAAQAAQRAAAAATLAARQSRQAYQQLGFQISDVAAQAAAGTNPMVIFAQQGGQVAQALSTMGGVVGRVAGFLAGPWGAALLGAAAIAGVLWARTRELKDETKDHADAAKEAKEAVEALNRALGTSVDSAQTALAKTQELTLAKLQEARATREQAKAELERARANEQAALSRATDPTLAGEGGFNPGIAAAAIAGRRAAALEQQIAEQNRAIGALNDQLLQNLSDRISRSAEVTKEAAEKAARAQEEQARRAAAAAREAASALEAQRRELEGIARAGAAAVRALAGMPEYQSPLAADDARRAAGRVKDDPLRALADGIEVRRDAALAAEAAGRDLAEAANRELLRGAQQVGFAIGGKAGQAIGRVAGFLEGAASGNFASTGGVAGGIFGALTNLSGVAKNLGSTFKGAGKAVEGLFSGKGVGGLAGLSNIAGAAGIAFSAVTTLISLFKKRTGSVSLSASGGEVLVGAATGNNAEKRGQASDLGGAFADSLNRIAETLGATIGDFRVSLGLRNDKFVLDTTGQNRVKGKGLPTFSSAEAALAAALEDALRDGAIQGVSPAVKAALSRYGSDVNKAVSEAVKVQGLEALLEARDNPFIAAFRDFEKQARERVRIAQAYGFDVLEIERLNAEERKQLAEQTAQSTARAARDLLDELRFGDRAEGSPVQRLAALSAERSRLEGLFAAGDSSVADTLARLIEQQLDVAREAFGTAGGFAGVRSDSIAALERIVRQTDERIAEASLDAQRATVDKLTEANVTLDEQVALQAQMAAALQTLAAGGGTTGGATGSLAALYARAAV